MPHDREKHGRQGMALRHSRRRPHEWNHRGRLAIGPPQVNTSRSGGRTCEGSSPHEARPLASLCRYQSAPHVFVWRRPQHSLVPSHFHRSDRPHHLQAKPHRGHPFRCPPTLPHAFPLPEPPHLHRACDSRSSEEEGLEEAAVPVAVAVPAAAAVAESNARHAP